MEKYEYSKSQHSQNHPRNLAAKVGIVTGSAGMLLSWAIDVGFVEASIAGSPGLLTAGWLAGFLCLSVSVMHLRSA